jgi:Zn-finger nucleic acid-binding protein
MHCPVCKNVELVMSERSGIEIDYCPNCRGVWLDRGELDKIIERSSAVDHATQRPADTAGRGQVSGGWHGSHGDHGHHGHRRHSFWKELFD